ncbi:hypothetical protein BDN70DRAFT_894135 [Pholiota conissans]|uniref:Copper transport protein n=1 Tax=Pholiota conissans TaxID=109636 RepID=A0A9P5Z2W4_9AGAR|nr:hypothetical protein BDN70DRAFT_894135 [Pholiota conissans]
MAHNHDDMSDMSGPSNTSGMSASMMVPYLHFTGGDYLFFEVWRPSSSGAIAGVCICLAVLAFFERWLAATRAMFEMYWRRRALAATSARDDIVLTKVVANASGTSDKHSLVRPETRYGGGTSMSPSPGSRTLTMESRRRTVAPFIAAHDVPRGILFALQMLIMYLLMLAVMTFQAAYLISIIVGLGLGEVVFGRVAGARGH